MPATHKSVRRFLPGTQPLPCTSDLWVRLRRRRWSCRPIRLIKL